MKVQQQNHTPCGCQRPEFLSCTTWKTQGLAEPKGYNGRWPQLVLLCGLLGVLSGCIRPEPGPLPATRTPTPPVLDLAQASQNRLLVLDTDGNLFTVQPDGSKRFDLTNDATRQRFYSQPTWSPTGERIAWAEISSAPGEVSGALLSSSADGTQRTRTATPFPPFYLFWRPDGQQVAFLSNWVDANERTIALRLADVTDGAAEARTLGVGSPFYFSWSPDSQQLLTHIGNEQVTLLPLDGAETVLTATSARFAAPQWSADGQKLLYGINQESTPQLILADRAGTVEQVVTFFKEQTATAFALSPNGQHLAYTETDRPVGTNSFGPLFLFDLATEEFEQLASEPVLAFFWSPAGDALLFFSVVSAGQSVWLQAQVWDGKTVQTLSRFVPSDIFLGQYLPFADQYAQSTRFWAPDGRAFVYAGQNEAGQAGIWVQQLDATEPELVTEGVFATWSPN